MQYLFRDGRMVFNNGRAVNADCPEPCCGTESVVCYTKFTTCQYSPGSQTVQCADIPIDHSIWVSRAVLLALFQSSGGVCNHVTSGVGVILYSGRCYVIDQQPCTWYYPPEVIEPPFGLFPIPDGQVPVTGTGDVQCVALGCLDFRCFDSRWVRLTECEDQPNRLQRPNYVCARSVEVCGLTSVPNDAGLPVCVIANPEAGTLTDENTDPNGVFHYQLQFPYSTCCQCLDTVPESFCDRATTDTNDPCFPWTGERPDVNGIASCCCRTDDVICLEEWYFRYEPVAPDIITNGFIEQHGRECSAPGAISLSVNIQRVYPQSPGSNFSYDQFIGGYTPCRSSGSITDLVQIPQWVNRSCIADPVNGDFRTSAWRYERSCYGSSVSLRVTQYEEGTNTIRATWSFRARVSRQSAGGCAGGCGGAAVGQSAAAGLLIGSAKSAGGCVGCKGSGLKVEPA